MGGLSTLPGWGFLLFPELGPLAATVLSRPNGRWASSPWQLVVVPTTAAVGGLWIHNHVAIESLALLLAVLAARLLLSLFRSTLAPALSAAALPVIVGIHSWAYPVQIAIGLIGLNAVLAVLRRRQGGRGDMASPVDADVAAEPGWQRSWWVYLSLMVGLVQLTGWRVLLLPPLIVISHERFIEPTHCPWLGRAWQLPLACGIAGGVGVLAAQLLKPHIALGMGMSLGVNLLLMQRLRMWLPPLLAAGLLPFLIPDADGRYVLGITVAAAVLALSSPLARARWARSGPSVRSCSAPRPGTTFSTSPAIRRAARRWMACLSGKWS
ncbi:hypothetical protein NZK33_03330 [Cyanobium sp. FGCU-6]|nr:hypothetical protein [Cyanobium sp. FGCU6]